MQNTASMHETTTSHCTSSGPPDVGRTLSIRLRIAARIAHQSRHCPVFCPLVFPTSGPGGVGHGSSSTAPAMRPRPSDRVKPVRTSGARARLHLIKPRRSSGAESPGSLASGGPSSAGRRFAITAMSPPPLRDGGPPLALGLGPRRPPVLHGPPHPLPPPPSLRYPRWRWAALAGRGSWRRGRDRRGSEPNAGQMSSGRQCCNRRRQRHRSRSHPLLLSPQGPPAGSLTRRSVTTTTRPPARRGRGLPGL